MNPYIQDILSQPAALRGALTNYASSVLEKLDLKEFDRIIISGMGSSCYAAYPALMQLSNQSVPVQLVNAAELLHSLSGIIGSRSLLWLSSQSGQSAELVHLLDKIQSQPPARLLTFVNECLESDGATRRHLRSHPRGRRSYCEHQDVHEYAGC